MKALFTLFFVSCFLCLNGCGEETAQEKMKNKLLAEGFGPLTNAESTNQELTKITPNNY